jgi:hypothetical protein
MRVSRWFLTWMKVGRPPGGPRAHTIGGTGRPTSPPSSLGGRTRLFTHLFMIGTSLSGGACATIGHSLPAVCAERRVYVESFGTSEFAAQFSILLQGELPKQGFDVARRPEDADLVLTGILAVAPAGASGILARALNARSREELWRSLYESERPKKLASRAEDVAEDLLEHCRMGWRKRT